MFTRTMQQFISYNVIECMLTNDVYSHVRGRCARRAGFHMIWDQAKALCLSDHQATNKFALHEEVSRISSIRGLTMCQMQVLATSEQDDFAYPGTITKIFVDGAYLVAWAGGRAGAFSSLFVFSSTSFNHQDLCPLSILNLTSLCVSNGSGENH